MGEKNQKQHVHLYNHSHTRLSLSVFFRFKTHKKLFLGLHSIIFLEAAKVTKAFMNLKKRREFNRTIYKGRYESVQKGFFHKDSLKTHDQQTQSSSKQFFLIA